MYPEPDVFVWGSSVYQKWPRSRPIFGPFSRARNVLGLCRKGPRRYNFAIRSMKGKKTTTSKQKQINIIIMSLFNICILWISWGDQIFKVAHGLNDSDEINYVLQHSNRGDASICIDIDIVVHALHLIVFTQRVVPMFCLLPNVFTTSGKILQPATTLFILLFLYRSLSQGYSSWTKHWKRFRVHRLMGQSNSRKKRGLFCITVDLTTTCYRTTERKSLKHFWL